MAPAVRIATCLLAAVLMTSWTATAAIAQDRSLLETTQYRSTITAVEPSIPGLDLAVIETGALTVTSHIDETVIVIGYEGEAYLRITPAGVEENVAALSSSVNGSLVEDQSQPSEQASGPHEDWRPVSDKPTVTYHDHRTHWMAEQPPPDVAADPGHPHKVFDWTVPLTVDGEPVAVQGTLNWTGLPNPTTWTTVLLAFAGTTAIAMAATIAFVRTKERIAKRVQREPARVGE